MIAAMGSQDNGQLPFEAAGVRTRWCERGKTALLHEPPAFLLGGPARRRCPQLPAAPPRRQPAAVPETLCARQRNIPVRVIFRCREWHGGCSAAAGARAARLVKACRICLWSVHPLLKCVDQVTSFTGGTEADRSQNG